MYLRRFLFYYQIDIKIYNALFIDADAGAPIFIMMLLFQVTKELFDIWIKQVIATGILYIMIAASIVIMVKLIFGIGKIYCGLEYVSKQLGN